MKVLVVHNPYQIRGGEDLHVTTLMEAYRGIGIDAKLYPEAQVPKTPLLTETSQSLISSMPPDDFLNQVREFSPDLFHIHNIYPTLGPSFLTWAIETKARVFMTIHNHRFFCTNGLALRGSEICKACFAAPSLMRPVFRNCNQSVAKSVYYSLALHKIRTERLFERAIERYIAPSPYISSELIRYGISADRVTLIIHPVEVPTESTAVPNEKTVFFAGRLSSEKGIEQILEVAQRMPDLQFVLAGDGPLRARVENAIHVKFLGRLSHSAVFQNILKARIAVAPSLCNESLSYFALESFALGRRCVVPDLESTRWLADQPFLGVLTDPRSTSSFTDSILRALALPLPTQAETKLVQAKVGLSRFQAELKSLIE